MDFTCIGLFFVLSTTLAIAPTAAATSALLLTPFIKLNQTAEARNRSLVTPALFLDTTSHSGFLTVDEEYNSNTFFWYFPVINKPVPETPWIIWLQGGPGATSLYGLFDEIGPFEYTNNVLKLREWSWSRQHSMLFIDNPIGAGFSFTGSEQGFATNSSTYSNHLYSAVQQFLTIFPELRSAPLYIAGESYAGHYVPALAVKIKDNTDENRSINLQGIILGNPVLDREDIENVTAVFHQWGLIDTQGALAVRPLQDAYVSAIQRGEYAQAAEFRNTLLDRLSDLSLQKQLYNILVDDYDINEFEEYLRREDVREALHVGDVEFTADNGTARSKLLPDFLFKLESKIEEVLEHYRVLIYCGQLDLVAPCAPSAGARRRWRWSRRRDFLAAPRVPWSYDESVAGYVKSGGGFTEALVRGAGHLVPIDKPAQAYRLVSYFIRRLDMPLPANYKSRPDDTPDLLAVRDQPHQDHTNTGMIISIAINVALVAALIVGVVSYIRLKRKTEAFCYNMVDNVSDDIFLT
ncbi:venom serine carboxypeptidase-like [Hyposmocoma kahamanoa]|uniref:venom serine carboxypeptidase-like n=1 Tax=Hyposmocoma kahamanoa TaxID=1477025 RepID=UPI000E6DA4DC|nr:venom serine carboxypeptidase-like [Hyposmocoma kahamanoa]